MFEFHKKHIRSSHQRISAHGHGRGRPASTGTGAQSAANAQSCEKSPSHCPLCGRRCPLSTISCPKGAYFLDNLYIQQEAQMDANNAANMDTILHTGGKAAVDMTNDGASTEMLASLFHRAAKLMMRAHHRQGHAEHAQMRVLAILKQNEPISQRELLDILNVRSASLSELLGKLEHRNLIRRNRDGQDKRSVIITLTEQGSAAAAAAESARRQSFDAIFATLSEDERTQFAGALRKIITSMEQHLVEHHTHGEHGGGHMRGHGHDLRECERGRRGPHGPGDELRPPRGGRAHGERGRGHDDE